jgi:hypothetical protein
MFPRLPACAVGADAIEELVGLLAARAGSSGNNTPIPAGFTYLGQFIDHDITFDPTKLGEERDPGGLVNFRTPRLDLDSLYGSGPVTQPFLYDWKESEPVGTRLLVGHDATRAIEDLPRNQQDRALIGDPRNDENLIVSQLHLLFIRFHNAVVDHLVRKGVSASELLEEARRIVRWHYQWIVVHEFLPKVVGKAMAKDVLTSGRRYFKWRRRPFIPVEFSGAAYRFGHSMVRSGYGIKRLVGGPPPQGLTIFPDLAGFRRLSADRVIYWGRFFQLPDGQEQSSLKIDTSIAEPLFELPDGEPALPRRNLLRGRALELPSGQDVACTMHVPALAEEELRLDGAAAELRRSTPLWYYILCEAEKRLGDEATATAPAGRHLGPVGGRIVAEVLVGLLEGDPTSYLRQEPPWRPGELGTGSDFTMARLVEIAQRPSER